MGVDGILWNKLFKKTLIYQYQSHINPQIYDCEDNICTFACCASADKIVVMGEIYYHYRDRANSITKLAKVDLIENIALYYQSLETFWGKHPARELLMDVLKRDVLYRIVTGINRRFSFGFGLVIPYYYPPHDFFRRYSGRKIALYGAGNVGQSYYRLFQLVESSEITAWVDQQWE